MKRSNKRSTWGNKRYPEQSTRQAMRGERRAQGGPGIVLVNGEWVPRTAQPAKA